MILEKKCNNYENEIKELSLSLNYELTTIIQWIETYFGVYFQKNVEIPTLPRTQSQIVFNKVSKLEILKEVIIKTRATADNELNSMELIINDQKNELSENSVKRNKYMKEISYLKDEILNKNNDVYTINQKHDSINENYIFLEEEHKKLHEKILAIEEKNNEFNNKIGDLIQRIFENFRSAKYLKYAELINYQSYSENRVTYLLTIFSFRMKKY